LSKETFVQKKSYSSRAIVWSVFTVCACATFVACFSSQAKSKITYTEKGVVAGKEGVVGSVDGQDLLEKDLPAEIKKELTKARRQEHEILKAGLNQLLAQKIFTAEAEKAKMTYEEYLDKKVYKKIEVSEKDVKTFLKSRGLDDKQIAENPAYLDQAKPYVEASKRQEILEERLAKETKSRKVEAFFKKPVSDRIKLEIGNAPITSSKDAKVQLIIFSDFQCPYCSQAAKSMDAIKKKFGKKVNIAFKHFPLVRIHPDAFPTSEMSLCVRDLGGDKAFWKFHDIAFENQRALGADKLPGYAKQAGVKEADAKACLEAHKFKAAVEADMAQAETVPVNATPTIFINGMENPAGLAPEALSEVIEEELQGPAA